MLRVAVVGLGKLGYPIACSLTSFHSVYGLDKDRSIFESIKNNTYLIEENCSSKNIELVTDDPSVVAGLDVIAIVTPTPSLPDGTFDSSSIIDVILYIGKFLRAGQVVVVCSTVMPGECDGPIRDALNSVSSGVSLVYSPEFVALGSVSKDFLNPDFVLIGTNDSNADEIMHEFYKFTDSPKMFVSTVEAEIAKISLNTYITMKISYANSIARICEQYVGADARNVCNVLGTDSRIGSKYFMPATSYGGPCFVRDTKAFSKLGYGDLADAADKINDRQLDWITDQIKGEKIIGILGLTYKDNTRCVEESIGTRLADWCKKNDIETVCYDAILGGNIEAEWQKTVVVCTKCDEFIGFRSYAGQKLIDLWDICDGTRIVPGRK